MEDDALAQDELVAEAVLGEVDDSASDGVIALPGIGFTMASWIA